LVSHSFISRSQTRSHCHLLLSLCHYSSQNSLQVCTHFIILDSINKLFHRKPGKSKPMSQFPSNMELLSLPSKTTTFFSDKVVLQLFHSALKLHTSNISPHIEPSLVLTNFTFFSPATTEEICKLISQSSKTLCDLDISSSILSLLLTITNIANLSLSCGVFP